MDAILQRLSNALSTIAPVKAEFYQVMAKHLPGDVAICIQPHKERAETKQRVTKRTVLLHVVGLVRVRNKVQTTAEILSLAQRMRVAIASEFAAKPGVPSTINVIETELDYIPPEAADAIAAAVFVVECSYTEKP